MGNSNCVSDNCSLNCCNVYGYCPYNRNDCYYYYHNWDWVYYVVSVIVAIIAISFCVYLYRRRRTRLMQDQIAINQPNLPQTHIITYQPNIPTGNNNYQEQTHMGQPIYLSPQQNRYNQNQFPNQPNQPYNGQPYQQPYQQQQQPYQQQKQPYQQ